LLERRRPRPNESPHTGLGFSSPYYAIVNRSRSSSGAPYPDVGWGAVGPAKVALGAGGGAAFGLGTAIARGGAPLDRTSGVSDGLGEIFFFGVGDFSPAVFFFFFDFAGVSFSAVFFFAFGFGVGVSLGVVDASDSSTGAFFTFGFGFGEGDGEVAFFFLDVFGLGVGLGVSSVTARAFRIRVGFSSSDCC